MSSSLQYVVASLSQRIQRLFQLAFTLGTQRLRKSVVGVGTGHLPGMPFLSIAYEKQSAARNRTRGHALCY